MNEQYKHLNKLSWKGYPLGDLSKIVVVYFASKYWKVVPFNVLEEYPLLYDKTDGETVTVARCPISNTICVLNGKFSVKQKKPHLVLQDSDNCVYDVIKGRLNDECEPVMIFECYVCSVNESLQYFKDCLYLTLDKEPADIHNELCDSVYSYGIRYRSKQFDDKGIDSKKTILVTGSFKDIKKWLNNNSSSITEKNGVIIPTSTPYWMSVFPNSKHIKLN